MENIISCPAKLNLSLNINNFRSDGFHEIQSIFAKINLYDELIVEKNSQFQLSIQGIFSKKLDKGHNIINKIYNYFEQNFDLKSSVKVTLKKNIPIGAGLGGGSSDGASFIKILNKIFDLKLSKIEMQKISINFGSDLPFFFEDDICLVEGRGESITSLNNKENNQSESLVNFLNNYKTLLIFPQIHISTIDVYKELINRVKNSLQKYSLKYDQNYLTNNRVIDIILNSQNELEPSAFYLDNNLDKIKTNIQKFFPNCVKMTGSGSSFFAIFSDKKNYVDCVDFFEKFFPNFFLKKDIKFIL